MSTLFNDRDIVLQASAYRSTNTAIAITATASAFKTPKNGAITIPSSIILTAVPSAIFTTAATYAWAYALSNASATWIPLVNGTNSTIIDTITPSIVHTATVTNTNILGIIGEATWVQYRCTVTENLLTPASDFFTVTYSKEVSEPIAVDISRTNASILCSSAGVPVNYNNTDSTISVSRGGVALTYNASGGIPNTFKVDIQADDVARTIGTISNNTTTYSISGITNIAVDLATVVFVVTVYDASGTIVSPTFTKRITYIKVSNGMIGSDATFYYIEASSPVISKSTSSALITGTHSNITVIGKKVVGSTLPVTAGYLTITGNGDTESTTASNPITTSINNTAGKSNYTIKLYNQATVAGATLLDTEVIPVLFTGSSAIIVALTNDACTIPTNSAGTAGIYTGTSTDIHVYEGINELAYDGVGTTNGTWTISSNPQSNITIGTITDSGAYATIGIASNIAGDTASIVYNISGTSAGGLAFTLSKTQTFSRAYAGVAGVAGSAGQRSITINAFAWGTSMPAIIAAITYTWATGAVSAYPAGWTGSAPASTASGQTLYQISLVITDLTGVSATTVSNWSAAVSNTIGYRLDGSIGPQGNSARVAYIVTTSGTPPTTPIALTGDQAPTSWSFTATSILTAGQYMYQSDGILATGGNIAWGIPYLSNLKVGSLSALSADLGTVSISTTGSLATTGKLYGNNTNGVFLGYDTSAYKLQVGANNGSGISWDGTTFSIRNTSGTTILSSGNVAADILNSNVSIGSNGTLSGAGGGTVSLNGLGAGSFATLSQITHANASTYIAAAAIDTAQIANLAVGTALIANAAITNAKIADLQVTTGKIADLQVTTLKIGDNAVTTNVVATSSFLELNNNVDTIIVSTIYMPTPGYIYIQAAATLDITANAGERINATMYITVNGYIFGTNSQVSQLSTVPLYSGWNEGPDTLSMVYAVYVPYATTYTVNLKLGASKNYVPSGGYITDTVHMYNAILHLSGAYK